MHYSWEQEMYKLSVPLVSACLALMRPQQTTISCRGAEAEKWIKSAQLLIPRRPARGHGGLESVMNLSSYGAHELVLCRRTGINLASRSHVQRLVSTVPPPISMLASPFYLPFFLKYFSPLSYVTLGADVVCELKRECMQLAIVIHCTSHLCLFALCLFHLARELE